MPLRVLLLAEEDRAYLLLFMDHGEERGNQQVDDIGISQEESPPAKAISLIQTSRRMDSFLHEVPQNFELLSNIQDQIKNKKPIADDVLFKAYPMVPHGTSCRSNLAGRYLQCSSTKFLQISRFLFM